MRGKRVVFFSTPAKGHVNAVYPVLRALARAGVQVDWYGTEEYRELIVSCGAAWHSYRIDFSRYSSGGTDCGFLPALPRAS